MDAATETGFIKKDEKGEPIATGEDGCKGYLKWLAVFLGRSPDTAMPEDLCRFRWAN